LISTDICAVVCDIYRKYWLEPYAVRVSGYASRASCSACIRNFV